MFFNFKLLKILSVFIIFLGFVSCKNNAKLNTSITIAFQNNSKALKDIKYIIPQIKKDLGVQIIIRKYPEGPLFFDKLKKDINSQVNIDLICVNYNNFCGFYPDFLEDLTPFISKDKKFLINKFFKSTIKRFSIDNKQLALPVHILPKNIIYINENIFNTAGINIPDNNLKLEDIINIGSSLIKTDVDGNIIQYGFGFDPYLWKTFVYYFNGKIVDNIKKPLQSTFFSNAKQGILFIQNLVNKKIMPPFPDTTINYDYFKKLFIDGQLAMYYSDISKISEFNKIKTFKWTFINFPLSNFNKIFPADGYGYSICSFSQNKENAFIVLKYITGENGQSILLKNTFIQPTIVKLAASSDFLTKVHNSLFSIRGVDNIHFDPLYKNWDYIEKNEILPILIKIFNKEKNISELKNLDYKLTNYFSKK